MTHRTAQPHTTLPFNTLSFNTRAGTKAGTKAKGAALGITLSVLLAACGSGDGGGFDHSTDFKNIGFKNVDLKQVDRKVAELMARMSLEQKVGQMIQGEIAHVTPADVRRYGLGSVLNGGGSFPGGNKRATRQDWLALADAYHRAAVDTSEGNAGIPIIWGTDAVHGHNNVIGATLYPHNIGLGAANDPRLVARIAEATADAVRATGIDWNFAPTIAVAKDFRWGRTYESYSSDPALVSRYAGPFITAMQSRGIVATAKHFVGDGGTHRGVDQGDTRLSLEQLMRQHGQGYSKTIEAGALTEASPLTVMASFNSWNGDKIHGNRTLLTDVLKQQLGFAGFVISDWNGIGQVEGCTNASCPQAINAGIDMVMAPEDWRELHTNMVAQVRAGAIPQARIDDAVRRILRVKFIAGLMDREPPSKTAAGFSGEIGHPEHRALAREAVRRSLVLLKNDSALLPLNPRGNYLVTGPGADNMAMQCGGWTITWQGTETTREDFPGATTIMEGFQAQVGAAGGQTYTDQTLPSDLKPDAAVVVFGETPYAEGEGDRETLAWAGGATLERIRALRARDIPVVAVFLSGRPLHIPGEMNAANAFVAAWLPGSEGAGVADMLLADARGRKQFDFSGRLPMPWPREALNSADPDLPVASALYPVGFGLSLSD